MKASADSSPGLGKVRTPESANAPEFFGLTGPSVQLDRRINAVRGDIADIALAGVLFAPHYALPMERRCIVPVAPIREKQGDDAPQISELLLGEAFAVIDLSGGWAWGYSSHDHYVGYVRQDALGLSTAGPWRVAERKIALVDSDVTLPMGAYIDGVVEEDRLLTDKGPILLSTLVAVNEKRDPVEQAEKLLGAPYHWGGRHAGGIDCSGLVQLALSFAGKAIQRDSDLQAASAGEALPDKAALQRGDLVFFPGHVGMMIDHEHMIHANSHAGAVSIEPLADVKARMLTEADARMTARRP